MKTSPGNKSSANRPCDEVQCILYLRLSDARVEHDTFPQREAKLRAKADQLGWTVVDVVIENDVMPVGRNGKRGNASAFKKRRVVQPDGKVKLRVWRPGFQSMIEALEYGAANAILAEDLDRTLRDGYDAQDLLAAVKACGGHAASISSSLKLTNGGTDAERMNLVILASVAEKFSADQARRVSDGRERTAQYGRFGGGPRPYGFEADGVTIVPTEAAHIEDWANAVLMDIALRSVARDLDQRGVPTVRGNRWTAQTIRDILLRPRNAAISVHKGVEVGDASWKPILPVDVWRAVVNKLHDPESVVTWTTKDGQRHQVPRGTNVGRAPCWLGTGIYRCVCGATVVIQSRTGRGSSYKCGRVMPDGTPSTGEVHVSRDAASVDEHVIDRVVGLLARPDLVALAAAPASDGVDLAALRQEIDVLRQLSKAFASDHAAYVASKGKQGVDRPTYLAGVAQCRKDLDRLEAVLASHTKRSPVSTMAGVKDPYAAWEGKPLGIQRAIVDELLTVTILPGQRGHTFDPKLVKVAPRKTKAPRR